MTWYQKATKDVAGCEKPRGTAKQVLIRGFPNGVTHPDVNREILSVRIRKQTEGSETSQYLQEKKKPLISSVAASERETV